MSPVLVRLRAVRLVVASAVFAAGAVFGALAAARRGRVGMRLLVLTALAFGALEMVTGLMPTYWSFLLLLLPTGMAVISFSTAANSSVQLGTAADMRGRVMGIYMLVFLGGTPIGAPLTGLIAQEFGTRLSIVAQGAISIVGAALVAVLVARVRGVPVRRYLRRAKLAPQ
jgi:MFS family permease